MTRYTAARRSVQGAFAALFAALPFVGVSWLGGTAVALRVGPVDVLEPVSAASAMLAAGAVATVAVLGAVPLVLLSVALGSVFCGWMCPYGLVSEGLDRVRHGRNARWLAEPTRAPRRVRTGLLAALLLTGVLLGVPAVALLAPPRLISALPIEARALRAVPPVSAALLAVVLAIDLAGPRRIVCRVLCPVGAGAALLRARFTWRPRFDARACSCPAAPACWTACKWGLDPRHPAALDGCTACLACIERCPSGALQLRRSRKVNPTEVS